jgi:branched-chain amino acid transport system substrate-binding protein
MILNLVRRTAAAALLMTVGAFPAEAQVIKIGFNGDLSASPTAQSGQVALLGAQVAVDDLNKAGGVLGRKLEIIVRDDVARPPKSIQNINELIDNEKVVAVLGPTSSGNALAWRHIPNQKKIPVIVPIATATDVTRPMGPENYMFRISMVDRDQAAALIAYVKKNPAVNKIGFFAETTGYGQAGLKDLEEVAALQGIKPVVIEKFDVQDTDMTSQLNKAKAADVDAILVWAQSAPIAHLLRSMEKIDYFPLTLTTWSSGNDAFVQVAGTELMVRPLFMTTVTDESSPRNEELYRRLADKIPNASLFLFAAQGYDAVLVLAAALEQAQSTDGPKVRAALENLTRPVEGYVKTYAPPFTTSEHEALSSNDFRWVKWREGKVQTYADDVTRQLGAADFKK